MSSVSRREFAAQVSSALSGAVAASVVATTSAADAMPQTTALATDKTAPVAEPAPTPTPSFEDHQLAVLKELYPAPHLTDEMLEGIRGGLKHNRSLAERIRKVSLTHDVPPAFQFVVPPA